MTVPKLSSLRASAVELLKRPRTIAAMAFLAVGAAIVANALTLQPGPHPAPFFVTRARQTGQVGQPDEIVRDVQDALMQVGYYSGPLDGLAGPQTRSAIKAFEAQSGRDATGEASFDLLQAIRASSRPDLSPVATRVASPETQHTPQSPSQQVASAPPTAVPNGVVAAVQGALARSAYGPLAVDGVAGPETRDAIVKFQRDHNLPITGEINDALIIELRADGALGGG